MSSIYCQFLDMVKEKSFLTVVLMVSQQLADQLVSQEMKLLHYYP